MGAALLGLIAAWLRDWPLEAAESKVSSNIDGFRRRLADQCRHYRALWRGHAYCSTSLICEEEATRHSNESG